MARSGRPAYAASITTDELLVAPATAAPTTRAETDDIEFVPRAPRRRPPVEVVGLVGVVLAFVGLATIFAFQQPPFWETDEKSHLGYAHAVASFQLPEVETLADVPSTATQWAAEMVSSPDRRYRGVWVANHPPLNYVVAAPSIWYSNLTDRADGGLLFLRLQNVAFAAAGIVFTYLFATELTRLRRIGLAAAALAALTPQAIIMFSRGMNDGLGFAAATGLLWSATRLFRRGDSKRDLVLLSAMAVAATGARTATMLLSVAVVGLLGLTRLFSGGSLGDRLRRTVRIGLVGLGPAALAFGWYYLRNMTLYGDIGGSDFVLRYFRRADVGSIVDIAKRGEVWGFLYRRTLSTAPMEWTYPRFGTAVAIVLAAGFITLLLVRRTGDRDDEGRRVHLGLALVPGLVSVLLIALTVAQHISGGGNWYPRYFLPVLGVLATFAVLAADRVVPRVLPVVVIAVLAIWTLSKVPVDKSPIAMLRPRDQGPPPTALRSLPGGDLARNVSGGMLVAGVLIAAGCLLAGVIGPTRRPRDETEEASAETG